MNKIVLGAKLELSRRYFGNIGKLTASDSLYKQDREYLKSYVMTCKNSLFKMKR